MNTDPWEQDSEGSQEGSQEWLVNTYSREKDTEGSQKWMANTDPGEQDPENSQE